MKQTNYRTSHKQRPSYRLSRPKGESKNKTSNITGLIAIFTGIISIISISTKLLQKELLKGYLTYFNIDPALSEIINNSSSLIKHFLMCIIVSLGCILFCYIVQKINKRYVRILIFIGIALIIPALRIGALLYLSHFTTVSPEEIINTSVDALGNFIQILGLIYVYNIFSKDLTKKTTPSTHLYKKLSSPQILFVIFVALISIVFFSHHISPLGEIYATSKKDFTVINNEQVIIAYTEQKAIVLPARIENNDLIIQIDEGYHLVDLINNSLLYKKFNDIVVCTQDSPEKACHPTE
ncbi:MAG: hypothetical protein HFI86_09770 [Bacilli bacterium]|uniref:hypothetical protein n=1 Tax=Turicibacter sp. TA25 TaxID=2951142 RepID=UPI0021D4D72E|nr:hypothetical protein [Turicibacter sp. TA25]MCI9435535.1 hypothetical protein [Bacilli bacterium]MCU7205493.1 hypothetical protein [Turicibacter sp. TA25]